MGDLLWAAFGINRPGDNGRTAPSALGAQEIDIYAALAGGLYIYDPFAHSLSLVAPVDARKVTGYQDFVDAAPLDLVYVADHAHMVGAMPSSERQAYSAVTAGAIAQNVYLYCASAGLATVVRGWFDRPALSGALGLTEHEHIIVAQTVGYPGGMKDADCVDLLQWALPQLGLRWPGFRKVRRQVCNRIAGRIRVLGLPDVAAYRHRLESQREEWPALAALCTVSISRFYRDREVFDCLGAIVLPELAGAAALRGRTHLECWSAGCCSGEEPYTLSIQWRLALAGRFPQLALRVLGTDVDATLIERARAACYRTSSLDALPAAWIEQAFERRGRLLCLRERFRQDFELERQDLLAELPRRQFDLVLCRNLAFTYFDSSLQQVALERIASRLRYGGALAIGVHERLPLPPGPFERWPGCRAVFRLRAA